MTTVYLNDSVESCGILMIYKSRSTKMKINEFIEKVNDRDGMWAEKTDECIVIGTPNNIGIFNIPEDATNFIEIDTWATSSRLCWKKPDREYLSALIEEFLHTPVKERFPEKKYRVPLVGCKSDNGPQYLSTRNNKDYFACAQNNYLQQEFTQDELSRIINCNQFRGVHWIQELLRNAEPVGEER